MNRRHFMKAGAVIGAALAVPDSLVRIAEIVPIEVDHGGIIRIYAGAIPSKPSEIQPGLFLTEIVLEKFRDRGDGILASRGMDPGTAEATGMATHFIMESPSKKHKAVGTVGRSGATLNMSNNAITTGCMTTIDTFYFAPALEKMDPLVPLDGTKAIEQFIPNGMYLA